MIEIKDSDTMISEMEQLRESHMSTISKRHQELNASLKTFMDEIDKNNAEIKKIDRTICTKKNQGRSFNRVTR